MNFSFSSQLFDENTFYYQFIHDLRCCKNEIIIESPYITKERVSQFMPIFQWLLDRQVKIFIITRDPKEHGYKMMFESEEAIQKFEIMGVQTLLCKGNHHRKLAIIDRSIIWEGSLNIFSQTHSREIMRRISDQNLTMQMFNFLKYRKIIKNLL